MGENCQSRYKFVPEVPEAVRTAQVWHLRYQGDFMQPSVVTVLRERAAHYAPHKRDRKARSPEKRVQVMPDDETPRPRQREMGLSPRELQTHPDIRPGEALVCKADNGQATYWALSKLVSGCEQWRQLADLPPKPPPGRGNGGGGRPPRHGILSPVPRKGVQFESTHSAGGAGRVDVPVAAVVDSAHVARDGASASATQAEMSPNETYLPQIQRTLQQRRMQRIRFVPASMSLHVCFTLGARAAFPALPFDVTRRAGRAYTPRMRRLGPVALKSESSHVPSTCLSNAAWCVFGGACGWLCDPW